MLQADTFKLETRVETLDHELRLAPTLRPSEHSKVVKLPFGNVVLQGALNEVSGVVSSMDNRSMLKKEAKMLALNLERRH